MQKRISMTRRDTATLMCGRILSCAELFKTLRAKQTKVLKMVR